MCARHLRNILGDYRIKGNVVQAVTQYAHGTNFVTKHSVERHPKGLAHKIALEMEGLTGPSRAISEGETSPGHDPAEGDELPSNTNSSTTSQLNRQPRIDDQMHHVAREAYKKLLKTAYIVAEGGLPLAHFHTVVKAQKANGVKLIDGCDSGLVARDLIHEIAESIREKLAIILCSSNAFCCLSDGLQAKKTGSEKELVLVRVIRGGVPVFYCVSLEDLDSYGDANAENLKQSIDNTFLEKIKISNDTYSVKLVSATSDGASVNMGIYTGLMARLRNDGRPWLVSIHCASHRSELALKDSLMKQNGFKEMKELLTVLFYLFQRSGKLKREMKHMGKVLNVDVLVFPKVHGTRFIGHIRKGLHHLLHNYGVLLQLLEHCIAQPGFRPLKAKLNGILKKLRNLKFLMMCAFYKVLLDRITKLSMLLQRGELYLFELPLALEQATSEIEEMREEPISECLSASGIEVISDCDDTDRQVVWN